MSFTCRWPKHASDTTRFLQSSKPYATSASDFRLEVKDMFALGSGHQVRICSSSQPATCTGVLKVVNLQPPTDFVLAELSRHIAAVSVPVDLS